MRVAAIDLGSNSFHMLVAEVLGPTSFEIVLQDKMMVQLGKTALVRGRLDAQSMERGLRCLDEFRRMALARRVERTLAVATSAIREAANGEEFLRRAREESGLSVRLISGTEEARLIHLAVSRHVDLQSEKALLIDIGGGSVELTVGDNAQVLYTTSAKVGFLRLHGLLVSADPITRKEAKRITSFVAEATAKPLRSIRSHSPSRVVGTSGSITTLLRLAQQRRGESGDKASNRVSRQELKEIQDELMKHSSVERAKRFDLDPLRSEFLPTALLSLGVFLDAVDIPEITVCPVALREGLIYDFLSRAKITPSVRAVNGDLRRQAVLDLAARCDYPADHSHKVAHLASQIFRQTPHLHGLGDSDAQLLEYAAILHDIGYHIGYSKHHKHAYYLIMNCDLRGFSPEERAIVANLVRYHRRAEPKSRHASLAALPGRARKRVKCLAAILRIADGLDMSHFDVVDEIKCTARKKKLHFQLVTRPGQSTSDLDVWAAKKHARYFEKLFGVETSFTARRPSQRVSRKPPRDSSEEIASS